MNSIRERLLGTSNSSFSLKNNIRNRLGLDNVYYKQEHQKQLLNEKEEKYKNYLDNKTILANTLNKEGLNVNNSNPFQANIGSNKLINDTRRSLNGYVSLNDVINNQEQALSRHQEQVDRVKDSMYDYAMANYLYNKDRVENEDVNLYDKTLGTVVRGVGDLFSNITTSSSYIIDENGRKVKAPTYNELKQSKVSESYNTGVGKFLGDTTYNMSKILGSQAVNVLTGGVGGTALYWSDMFLDNYHSSVRDGYDNDNAVAYSLASTAAEYLTGKFLGSATKKLTGGKTNEYEQLLDKLFNKFISNKTLTTFLSNAGSEATEEFIQEYLENINKLAFLENSKNIKDYKDVFNKDTFVDALYSAGVGALSGGGLGVLNQKLYGDTPDTNSVVDDITDDKITNISEKEEINNNNKINIDQKINNVNNTNSTNNINTNLDTIISQINEYETLKEQNRLNKSQEVELNNLKEQLNSIINNNISSTNIDVNNTNNTKTNKLPTVQDIVNQEKINNSSINLPVDSQVNNTINSNINSNKAILPTTSEFNNSNVNISTNNIKVDMAKIKPEIIEDIKGFKLGDPNIESYKGSYVKTMMNEVGIKVPTAMNYVSEVRSDMSFTTTKDLTRQQYASIGNALQKLRSVDITSVNNTNNTILPVMNDINSSNVSKPIDMSQIKQTKGNIPINQELLNKYSTAKEIFDNEANNFDGEVSVETNIPELNDIDISTLKSKETKELAYEIFKKYNSKSVFENDGNKITVSKSGINESVEKIFNNKEQRNLLKEHLQVFSDLGDIIEHATLVNQTREVKNRENINSWNYYFDGLNIDGEIYHLEFDVRSLHNGQNQYRVQRLQKKQTTHSGDLSNITNDLPAFGQSAFSENNIPQSNINVKSDILPTINNMQNNENNTSKLAPTREDFESTKTNKTLNPSEIAKLTKEDANTTPVLPSKASTNKVNDGNSHFAKNIKDKVNMLNAEQKAEILSKEDVRYYDKVTNKESLEKAFKRLNDGGKAEVTRWFNNNENIDSSDVAEGYILLKQYSDKAENAINLAEKDYYNEMVVETAKKMRKLGTTAGQIVQAFNIMERMTPEGMVKYAQSELSEAYDRMIKNKSKEWIDKHREDFDLKPDEVQFIMDTMKEVSKMEDGYDKRVKLAEIQKLMTDKLPPEKGAGIRSWMRISMLFNPKTQVRNVAGNALIMPVNSFGDLFSSYADKIISKKTGVRTTGNTNIKAMLEGMKKGAYEATNDYKKGINTKDMEGNRFEITNGKSFNDKTLIGKTLNRTESLLNYVMDVGDRVFSEAAFENSLQNQMVLNNTTEITQEMIDIAHQEALSRTWNDNNNYTRFVLGVRKGLNNLGGNAKIFGYGLGDVLIPFAKTPANLTKAIVDYSPAGLVGTITKGVNLKRALTNGQYTASMQHEFVQSLGKATAGTMLYVLGLALAKAGITSGDSDDDKDTANFLKNTLGINSYSIKIGNKSFTYDWAQPLAAPLSITANLVKKNKEDASLYENIISSLNTAGNILLEQSFLDSLNTVFSNNEGIATGIQEAILQLPARAVPTFSKQIADLVDGTQRTSFEYGKPLKTATNSIKAKIPFLSKTLNPSVDTMGREIQKYGGKNNIFNVFLNPANVSTENISKSAEEIYRLYKATGETDIMPRVAPYYVNQNGEKITMTSKQRAEYQKISGKVIEDSVESLLKNNEYKNLNDTEKARLINKIVNYSYNRARKEVLNIEMSNEYNKINSYVSDGGNVANYYLNKEEVDYSYTNPSKYKTITQITTYKKYLSYKEELKEIKERYNDSSQRKAEVIKYINSLNLNISQKAMLIKMNYSSYNTYDNQIINYINKQDITIDEKTEILEELGFKVRNGKVYKK